MVLEDFTTFTEVEEIDDIQKTTNHVDFIDRRNRTTYLYKDYGAAYFDDFEHLLEVLRDSHGDSAWNAVWMQGNYVKGQKIYRDDDDPYIAVTIGGTSPSIRATEHATTGTFYQGDGKLLSLDTPYYLKIYKNGTDYVVYIYTDSARTSLWHTSSITLQADYSMRYLFIGQTHDDGTTPVGVADMDDLDLQEVDVPTVTTQAATGLTVGAGTLHGTITATGGENADERGFDWDYDTGAPYAYEETDVGDFGTGAFEEIMSGFTEGNTVYFRGKANNSAGWGYGGELNFVVRKAIERSASAGIGVTGVSARSFIGVRSAAPSLSIVAVATREQVLERAASAVVSLVGTTGRTLAAFRSASADLDLVGVPSRVLHAIRSAGAATSIVAVASRTLSIFRSASATVAIVGTATRSWIGTRAASAALGLSAVAGRINGMFRTASASMSVVGTATRSWIGTRSAAAELSLIGTPGRILSAFRSAAASFSLVGTADRMLSAFRSASASLSMVGISERTLHAFRTAVASMSATGTAVREWVGTRTAEAAISTVATAARSQVLVRAKSASLGITAVGGRMTAAFREASASMNVTAVGYFFRRVIRGIWTTRLGEKASSLGFGGQIVILKEGEKEVEGEVSKKDG